MESNEEETEISENSIYSSRRYLYLVEGKTDEDKLKKLGCVFVLAVGGKYIRPDIMKFIQRAHEQREIVIITDPDGPGKEIEEKIIDKIGPCLTAHAEKKKAIRNRKVGIAEMDINDIKEMIRPFVKHDIFCDENFSLDDEDFLDLGLIGSGSKEKRMKLVEKYDIPYTSAKNVEDAMLILCRTRKDIEEDIRDE